jgi:cleavage and polyadenylation specificity factor subunit 3
MIKILPLGGAGEIGASCFYLNIAETGIILDCGMHPQKIGLDALPRFDVIKDLPVDYCLISHAHQDHIAALPYLVKQHPYIKIISTPQTRALAELTLHDSVSILTSQLTDEDKFPVYTHNEIDLLIQTIDYKAYEEKFIINGYNHNSSEPVYATFHDAGHILGSASIMIEHAGEKIFYSGDINLDHQSLIQGAEIPKEKADILMLECTYGSTEPTKTLSWVKEAKRFANEANKILLQGGSILIPVFSLGKMQEILSMIWAQMQSGALAITDIYTGGLGKKISRVYDYSRFVVPRLDTKFELQDVPQKDLYTVERPDLLFKNPSIILASSGMMIEGTMSFRLASEWFKHKNSAIFTVGYMEPNLPGYKIVTAQKGDKIKLSEFKEEELVECSISKFNFSAHSNREGLLEIVKKLRPDNIVLIHGDADSIDWMGAYILRNFKDIKVYAAETERLIEFI